MGGIWVWELNYCATKSIWLHFFNLNITSSKYLGHDRHDTLVKHCTLFMDSRDKLINHIREGKGNSPISDNSNKSILARGCDPIMAERAIELMPQMLGNPEMVAVTNDDDFIRELQMKKWSVIHFAPGACRYAASKFPIPGSRKITNGWGVEQYRELVRKHQGENVKIIETTEECQIIGLLRKALDDN